MRIVVIQVRIPWAGCGYPPRIRRGFSFFYYFKAQSIVDGAHSPLRPLYRVGTPTEAVIAVVGNHMGVVAIVYDVARFCKSEGIYCVASAKDGGGS